MLPHPEPATIAEWIRSAENVAALTGAGISTESGIPDFRGPNGLWTKNPSSMKLSDINHYMTDPEVRVASWKARLDSPVWAAEPNAGHFALAALERKGRLHSLVTQNIDGLHLKAGTSPEILVEIHGTAHEVLCMNCGERAPMERALVRVRAGEDDPPCRTCGGILKSATISFGQSLVDEDLRKAEIAAAASDVFLAIGSSLEVFPAANLPAIALRSGATLVVINNESTPFDIHADAVVNDPIGEVLPTLVELS
jgi:NAD-dependent protein deacetylase/lipoamidase